MTFKKSFKKKEVETENTMDWLLSKGIKPTENHWSISFTITTTHIENWFYSRNKLKADHLRLVFTIYSYNSWLIQLERKDKLYVAQWRPNNLFHINSQQLKYTKLTKWPEFDNPEDFPQFIKAIEKVLGIKFERHINVGGLSEPNDHINNNSQLFNWLKSCIDTMGTNMKNTTTEYDTEDETIIVPRKKVLPKKYLITQPNEETISFKDFNFKLSIIQELMYHQEILKPKFDPHEFADWYEIRRINIEEEGYDFIPEITKYFEDLPIPISLAKNITGIFQDGANEIYRSMYYFHDGEGDEFDIQSIEDAKYFPNLKEVRLCYAKKHISEEFKKIGIEVK